MKKHLSAVLAAVMFLSSVTFSFNAFAQTDISGADITLSAYSFVYTGKSIEPEVVVTLDGGATTLAEDTDYTVSYENNVNAGTATVKVDGIGNYSGSAAKDFTITPLSVKSSGFTFTSTSKAYPNVLPKYDVKFNDTLLKQGTDYTLTISNGAKVGVKTAVVTITGKGNFTGSKTFKHNVYPVKVSGFSTKNRKTDSLELNWNSLESSGVTGYKVYICDTNGNNQKLYKTVDKNSVSVTDLTPGKLYYFKVRAYVKSGDTTIYGEYSDVFKSCAKPAKVTIKSVTKSKDQKKLTVKWKKTSCSAYEVQYSTDKSFKKGVKTIVVNGQNKTSASADIKKSDKVYYARVRAYREYYSKSVRINGAWSSKISSSYSKLYATYTTNYVNNKRRTNNLKLACKAINGTVVYPGDTFSFNKTVGKRTAAKGYKEAYVFTGPNSHTLGIGGGVCQVASTMFNAALLGNLKIVERHQHSQRVTYCPLGRDAAIYWGSEDFKFKNNTEYPIKIKMKCSGGKLTCSYYVCYDVSPKKVSLKVSRSGNHFTLKRKVGGKVNYTAKSHY